MVDKKQVAASVAAKLFAAEDAVDAAVRSTAALLGELTTARQQLGLSAVVGVEVFDRLSASLQGLVAARGETAAAHAELARLHARMGLGGWAAGGGDKPPGHEEIRPAPAEEARVARLLRRA